jgi:hypothetical protein
MANYIFNRLDKKVVNRGEADVKHWAITRMYDDDAINALPDGDKDQLDTGDNGPTSIPSPFARIALVKTAFKEVAEGSGTKIYERLVSEALDIAEIFFTFSKWASKIDIIEWKKEDHIKQLNDVPSDADILKKEIKKRHRYLSNTYTAFLTSDATEYNFHLMSSIYILQYKDTGKVIGATSPASLFFSAPDNKELSDIHLSNNHKAFGNTFHLSERSQDFKDYLCAWCGENDADVYFSGFNDYVKKQIGDNDFGKAKYPAIKKLAYNNIYPNVCGKILYQFEENKNDIRDNSDFVVTTTVCKETNLPLILGGQAHNIKTWNLNKRNKWENHTVNTNQNRDFLPDGSEYPWLTSEDFLEDKIIQLHKPIEKGYFSGNHTNNAQKSVLLPLKNKFFEYFTVEELKEMITIDGSSSIKVTLSIPVKKDKVLFVKEYKSENIISLGSETNFMLFPNVKFIDTQSSFYRFGLFKEFNEIKKLSAKFFHNTNEIILDETNKIITRNTNDEQNVICTTYAIEQNEIDRINVLLNDNIKGVLIPDFISVSNNTATFTFAVDFGTTNTHIEYQTKVGTELSKIKPFEISEHDEQISWFVNPGDKISGTRLVADIDFIPEHIGYPKSPNIKVKFPTRTALIVANNANIDQKLPFAHTNIIMPFGKRAIPTYNRAITQLKWDGSIEEIGFYIDNLCYLMRNKVARNNGNLANTKIVWTYPLSMNDNRLIEDGDNSFSGKWRIAYQKYFGNDSINNCKSLTESVAPFYHYKTLNEYTDLINNLVSIDIGGGTTDVVFVKDGMPNYITSFKFAVNDLFGLGTDLNKIIEKHKEKIDSIIEEVANKLKINAKNQAYKQLITTRDSINNNIKGDIASYYFSLKDNEDITDEGKIIDFFKDNLQVDQNQKLVFLLFYTAIIYHTAQLMKAQGTSMPRHLTFSGNGSRIIYVLGKNSRLEKIATLIFEKIFAKKYGTGNGIPDKLEIIPNSGNPKEVTCKGAISFLDIINPPHPDYVFLLGNTTITNRKTEKKYSDLLTSEISLIEDINSELLSFIRYVLDELLNEEIKRESAGTQSIQEALSISQSDIVKANEIISHKEDIKNMIINKITHKVNNEKINKIEETLFFYPIPTLLRNISREIEKKEG